MSRRRGADEMLALLRDEADAPADTIQYARAYRHAASRARAGVVPTLDQLGELAGESGDIAPNDASAITALMRAPATQFPPVYAASIAAATILSYLGSGGKSRASVASAMLLCVGGATDDAWLPLPALDDLPAVSSPESQQANVLSALGREAQELEAALLAARVRLADDEQRVREALGRAAHSALEVLALLARDLALTLPETSRALGQTLPTAGAAVLRLQGLGITREITGRRRSRCFVYGSLIDLLAPPARA